MTYCRCLTRRRGSYYWRVNPRNGVGAAAPVNPTIWSYTNVATPTALSAPTSPGIDAVGVILSTELVWPYAANATGYDVYFGLSASGSLIYRGTISETSQSTSYLRYNPQYSYGLLSANTAYQWRIARGNSAGYALPGAVFSFTTAAAPAGAPGGVSTAVYPGAGRREWSSRRP